MGIFVEIEGMGRVAEFPDGTLDDVINEAIQRDFFGGQGGKMGETPEPAPAAPATPPANSGAYNPEALFQRIGGFGEAQASTPKPKPADQIPTNPKVDPIYQMGLNARRQGTKQYELFKKSYPTVARQIEGKDSVPITARDVAELIHPYVAPLRGAGRSLFKGFNEGMAVFAKDLDDMATYISERTGTKKGNVFANAARQYEENAEYWKEKAKEDGVGAVTDFFMETVGGAAPGIAEFMTGMPMYGLKGAAEAKAKGKDEMVGALRGAMERGLMGKLLHTASQLNTAPRMAATAGLFEEQARLGQGETDPEKLVKSAGTGAIFGVAGKGGISTKKVVQELFNLEKEGYRNVQAMDRKKSSVIGSERGEVDLAPALKVSGQVFRLPEQAPGTHGHVYDTVPTELLEKAGTDVETGYVDGKGKWYTDKEAKDVVNATPKDNVVDLITNPVREFHKGFMGDIREKAANLREKVELWDGWKFKEGDRLKSPKTGKLYEVVGKTWTDKPGYILKGLTEEEQGFHDAEKSNEYFIKMNDPSAIRKVNKEAREKDKGGTILLERRGGPDSMFFAPEWESDSVYGDTLHTFEAKNEDLYRGKSSSDFVSSKVDTKRGDPLIDRWVNKWVRRRGDSPIRMSWDEFMNLKEWRDPPSPGDPSSHPFFVVQSKAKQILKKEGYKGAEWSEEDGVNPHQYHIWDKSLINKTEGRKGKDPNPITDKEEAFNKVHSRMVEKYGYKGRLHDLMTPEERTEYNKAYDAVVGEAQEGEGKGTTLGMGLGGAQDVFAKGKGFRSNTADLVEKESAPAMPSVEWWKRIKAWGEKFQGVKEENKWSGVLDWLDKEKKGEKKVTKGQVLQKLEESKEGWLEPVEMEDQWSNYNMPGGIPGTEKAFAFKVPGPTALKEYSVRENPDVQRRTNYLGYQEGETRKFSVVDSKGNQVYSSDYERAAQDRAEEMNRQPAKFQSSHFPDIPDVVFHIRTHKMKDKEGRIGLVAETIQSDWHQQGKDRGYVHEVDPELQGLVDRVKHYVGDIDVAEIKADDLISEGAPDKLVDDWREAVLSGKLTYWSEGIPDAPFRDTWHEAALKRVLDMAAGDPEVEWVGWPSGKVQNERWGKGDEGEGTTHGPNWEKAATELGFRPDEFDIMSQEDQQAVREQMKEMGLKDDPGGTFLNVLYDSKLPKFAKGYVKKLGGEYKKDALTGKRTRDSDIDSALESLDELYDSGTIPFSEYERRVAVVEAERSGEEVGYPIHRIDLPSPAKGKIRTEGQTFYDLATGAVAAGVMGAATGDDKKKKPMTKREWFEQKKRGNK